eukprot:gnl/TRDRNA2_/TRDRNA2_168231_c1_seq1.p1 gnl/TRDRNA2_/TRDRNA2_168231_c1~~gnl/TRDRNA2_/TRDRNA2_168231_c1_seq1.p1  ORF type:complete len:460 (-),score=91.61 gnl/TRDRNA2_/TRDRNA2_168231_c1_seq1:98-1285(-)
MMAPWTAPVYISRVWCIFELYTAATQGKAEVEIAMPPRESECFLSALFAGSGIDEMWNVLAALDVQEAQASVPEDQHHILSIIKKGPGFDRFNGIVAEHLQAWIVKTSETYLQECFEDTSWSEKDVFRVCIRVADLFHKIGDPKKALNHYEKAQQIAEEGSGMAQHLEICLHNMSTIKRELGDLKGAEACSSRAALLREASGRSETESFAELLSAGNRKMAQRDFSGALHDLAQALAKLDASQEPTKEGLWKVFMSIGSAKAQTGDLDGSLEAFLKVKELQVCLGQNKTPDAADLLVNIGNVLSKKQDLAGALEAFEEARQILDQLGTLGGASGANLLLNIGVSKWNSKDADGALEAAEKALAILEALELQNSSTWMQAQQLINMAKQMVASLGA